jgi:hypothetical protein
MMLKNTAFCDVTPSKLIDIYGRFGGTSSGSKNERYLKSEAIKPSETSVKFYLNCVTSLKTIFLSIAMRKSDLTKIKSINY